MNRSEKNGNILFIRFDMEAGMGFHPKDTTLPFTPVLSAAQLDSLGYSSEIIDVASGHGIPDRIVAAAGRHRGPVFLEINTARFSEIADFTKKIPSDNMVAAYGFSPTQDPASVLESEAAKYCVVGEGEGIIPALVQWDRRKDEPLPPGVTYQENGQMAGFREASLVNTDDMPFIPQEILRSGKYNKHSFPLPIPGIKWGFVLANRGCRYNCSFCTGIARQSLEKAYRLCAPSRLVDEMWYQVAEAGRNVVSIEDDLFTGDREWVYQVLGLLDKLPRRIKWIAQTRLDCMDEEMIRDMKRSGCVGLTCGVESGSDTILKRLFKRTTVRDIEEKALLLNKYGIATRYTVMIGAPGETVDDFRQTEALINKLKPLVVQVYFCIPFSDTVISSDDRIPGECADDSLRMEEPQAGMSRMSAPDMEANRFSFYCKYYFSFGYFKRHFLKLLAHSLLNPMRAARLFASFAIFIFRSFGRNAKNGNGKNDTPATG